MNKNKIIKNAEYVETNFNNINDIISFLKLSKVNGKNYYITCKFLKPKFWDESLNKNVKLYSLLDDENSCFCKIYGKTKDEYQNYVTNLNKGTRKKYYLKNFFYEKRYALIERGNKLIYPEQLALWISFIEDVITGIASDLPIYEALNIMEILANNSESVGIENALKYIDEQQYTDLIESVAMHIVTNFSKIGPKFHRAYEISRNKAISASTEDFLRKIEEKNAKFEKSVLEA